MNYTKAIVRKPGLTYKQCISDHPDHHLLDLNLVTDQHRAYVAQIRELGVEIIDVEASHKFPDACFVEDNVVINKNRAFINNMGAESRRGEYKEYLDILKEHFDIVFADGNGTVDGGDVLHLDDKDMLISGLTQRTNREGVNDLSKTLDVEIKTIQSDDIIHLKSYISYLGNDVAIATRRYINHPVLTNLNIQIIEVHPDEAYAANALAINGTVILPIGSRRLRDEIKTHGFDVSELDISEFQKCEGALTCLSILY